MGAMHNILLLVPATLFIGIGAYYSWRAEQVARSVTNAAKSQPRFLGQVLSFGIYDRTSVHTIFIRCGGIIVVLVGIAMLMWLLAYGIWH